MDQCTHEVRLQYWKNIISLCHERPSGQTAKQWLKENGICEQTYYSWQRKIRQESYNSMQDTSKEVLSSLEENEISFSDISYPISNVPAEVDPADCNDRSDAESVEAIRPVAVIKNGSMTVAITNVKVKSFAHRLIQASLNCDACCNNRQVDFLTMVLTAPAVIVLYFHFCPTALVSL